jgi:uncharacterized OsmC-like protein
VVLVNDNHPDRDIQRRRTTTITETDAPTADNGVNVEALLGAREALTAQPELAPFQWRASCEWVDGTHSRTTIEQFAGLGDEHMHKQAFVLDTDHPEVFAAADHGVTPVEMVLAGLAGCLGAGVAAVAQNRGVQLRSVTANVEADMDLAGILGIDPDVRNGFSAVRVSYTIDADAPRSELEGIVAQSQKRSAVYDIITNPTSVVVKVA